MNIEQLITAKKRLEVENARLRKEIEALHNVAGENGRLRRVVAQLHRRNMELTLLAPQEDLTQVLAKTHSDELEDATTDLDRVSVAVAAGEQKVLDDGFRRVG